jgi:Holliday junction resolvase
VGYIVLHESKKMGKREKRLADKQEQDVAEWWPEASTTISSGNKFEKLDVQTKRDNTHWRFLIECKETQKASYSIKRELWEYINNRAYERSSEMRPCLAIRFNSPNIEQHPVEHKIPVDQIKVLRDIAVVDLHDLIELVEEIKELRKKVSNGNS